MAKITTYQPIIEKGKTNDLEALLQIYLNAKSKLIENGIHQWTDNYPTKTIIENDLKAGVLFQLKIDNEIIGAINLSEEQETEYQTIPWEFDDTKVLVIHRLVIDPKYQGKGHAHYLMDFAENYAISYGYKAIRLDTYSQNKQNIKFYQKRNYNVRGDVYFPGREFAFHCLEKEI